MRVRNGSLTPAEPERARETVAVETPARCATSLDCGCRWDGLEGVVGIAHKLSIKMRLRLCDYLRLDPNNGLSR